MDEVVRRAGDSDCDELSRLETLARRGIEQVRGGALRLQECAPVKNWAAAVADPRNVVLVGAIDGVIVAYMVMHVLVEQDRGLISHVYVEVGGRELGLGDTLVEHAIEIARSAGLSGIEAVALPGDRETKNLFERAGLTARKLIVYKSFLAPSVDPDTPLEIDR